MTNQEMEEEIRFHLEARSADLMKRGMEAAEADRQARLEFGSVARYREEGREAKGLRVADLIRQDLRFAVRDLWRSPGTVFVSVSTLGLAIAAIVLVFVLADGLVWNSLPYADADRIVSVRVKDPNLEAAYKDLPVNARHYLSWRNQCQGCEGAALFGAKRQTLIGQGAPQRLEGVVATADLFEVLGLRASVGREFRAAEEGPAATPVALISDAVWRQSFGASIEVIGRRVLLNGVLTEVIGVLPANFQLPQGEELGQMFQAPRRVDVLMPIRINLGEAPPYGSFDWAVFVKLRPGFGADEVKRELDRILLATTPDHPRLQVSLSTLHAKLTERISAPLGLLALSASGLLWIACAGLANLLYSRGLARRREAAVRVALGASRGDLVRKILLETLLLSSLSGLCGFGLAWVGLRWISQSAAGQIPRLEQAHFGESAAMLAATLSMLAGLLCALGPVWRQVYRPRHKESLAEATLRKGLFSFEAGISVALATMASLLLVSYLQWMGMDVGFETSGAKTLSVASEVGYQDLLQIARQTPGVRAVGLTTQLPMRGDSCVRGVRRLGDQRGLPALPTANWRLVSPGFFEAAGTNLLAGRTFSEAERDVVILSASIAQQVFPNRNPLGQELEYRKDGSARRLTVVGVVEDVRSSSLGQGSTGSAYLPYAEEKLEEVSFVVRGDVSAATLQFRIREGLAGRGAVGPVEDLAVILDQAGAHRKLQALLAGLIAIAGILVLTFGAVGLVHQLVARRRHEIGVRLALGATQGQVVTMVLSDCLNPVLLGLAGGLLLSVLLGWMLQPQLHQVNASDPWLLSALCSGIGVVTLLAAYLAARRASQLEPRAALRAEA
jgi:putative ABC transport system permease protein